jgi:archaellum component FlaC
VAELNNYMVGRTGLDIDMKRASDILGFTTKEDFRSLRDLKAGQFYTFGSAFQHDGVEKFMVDKVQTTHPDRTRGIEITKPVETPENIKKLLKDLTNLPKEAEEELRSVEDMKKTIKELRYKLTIAEKSKPIIKVDDDLIWKSYVKGIKETEQKYQANINSTEEYTRKLKSFIERITREGNTIITSKEPTISVIKQTYEMPKQIKAIIPKEIDTIYTANEGSLRAGAMKMLNWLGGAYPNSLTKSRLATLSGFSMNGGTFNTYISELKRNGWIIGANEFTITEEGLRNAQAEEIPTGEDLLRLWQSKFREGAGKILKTLYDKYPERMTKEEIGYEVGFEPTGGTFNTYISELRRNNLIQVEGNKVIISEEFFE